MTEKKKHRSRKSWLKQYVVGLGLGGLSALYGVVALLTGRTYMPGFTARDAVLRGAPADAMALAFLCGGGYLFLRFFLERRLHKSASRAQIYMVQVALLMAFIGSLLFVLFKGSEVGGV
jgi:hypothetical protein